jgi:hypothetical protein
MIRRSQGRPHIEIALSLLNDATVGTWSRLHPILEKIERDLGKPVNKAGLCSRHQRDRFTQTANSHEASGKGARHAAGKFQAPTNPMTITEGEAFIRELLRNVLR